MFDANATLVQFRRGVVGQSEFNEQVIDWAELETVEVRLQGASGQVQSTALGREAQITNWLRGPSGWDLRQDDGLLVAAAADAVLVGKRFQVRHRNDWGQRGGMQADLVETTEAFG